MIVDGILEPMELGHLPYKKGTFEDYVGIRGLERLGRKKWRHHVERVISQLTAALQAEEVVLGGGNVKRLKELPTGCAGDNANAFTGGFRLWEQGQACIFSSCDRPDGRPGVVTVLCMASGRPRPTGAPGPERRRCPSESREASRWVG